MIWNEKPFNPDTHTHTHTSADKCVLSARESVTDLLQVTTRKSICVLLVILVHAVVERVSGSRCVFILNETREHDGGRIPEPLTKPWAPNPL